MRQSLILKKAMHLPINGGERGIRTLETFARLSVFKTDAFNRSAISPFTIIMKHIGESQDVGFSEYKEEDLASKRTS